MSKSARHMRGIEARKNSDGSATIYVKLQIQGKDRRETIGKVPADDAANLRTLARHPVIAEARRVLRQLREERDQANERNERWLSKSERAVLKAAAERQRQDARREILYDVAAKRFLDRCAKDYAHPEDVRRQFKRLDLAFTSRYLDEITRADIQQYVDDRLGNTGTFAGWPRTVGYRAPQVEIAALSALYSHLIDVEDRRLVNPCSRAWARRRKIKKNEAHHPKRRPVIPTAEELEALFDAAPTAVHRAAWVFCYYTAARPESEVFQLSHGDVKLPKTSVVRSMRAGERVLGSVFIRATKNRKDREVVLHPAAEAALRKIMVTEPDDAGEWQDWAKTPIFRRRDGSHWDRNTYRKGWAKTLSTVTKQHPRLRGMVVRDLRATANVHMRERGTDGEFTSKILGNTKAVNDRHYSPLTDRTARQAILSLGTPGSDTRVGHGVDSEAV